MSDFTPVPLTAEQERLTLAVSDMLQAAAAARLLSQRVDPHDRRALETAISVCYARPWLESNRSGRLKDKWLPAVGADRDLHKRLLELRHRTYAHSDPAGGRKASVQLGPEGVRFIGEEWVPVSRADLTAIAELCDRQAQRFGQAVVALERAGKLGR
jgi:hypothetical protein